MALRHTSMLEVNEFLVLDFIRGHERTSRPEIGRELGLSPSSISRIIGRMIRSGLVLESPGPTTAAGRRRNVIAFNHAAGAVMAVDLGGTKCHGALADLSGTVVVEHVRPTRTSNGAFSALADTIDLLRAEAADRKLPLSAVAIGIPAILDPDTGVAVGGPNVEWQGFEILSRLSQRLDVPFLVENDANLAALAHAWRGDGRGVDHFVTISIGTGIGAAIVANGRLVKGRHNAAGEIGYFPMSRDGLHRPKTDGLGGFEAVAAGPAIARRAAELLASGSIASSMTVENATPERVFAGALGGDPLACAVIDELLDWVALALVQVVATVDPEVMILEGSVGRSLEPHLAELVRRIAPCVPAVPRVLVSRLGPNATVVGAIAAALQLARRQRLPNALSQAFDLGQRVPA
jgi:glucokinase